MEQISRSEQKRQCKQVEAAARELVSLGDADLNRLALGPEVREAVALCRTAKGGALKRQIKFVAKLLRTEDIAGILAFLSSRRGSKLEEQKHFHDAEQWRDRIINEAIASLDEHRRDQMSWPSDWRSEAIDALVRRYPDVDEHDLRQTVHQYARSRNKSNYRETFRIIRAAADKQRRLDGHTGDSEKPATVQTRSV